MNTPINTLQAATTLETLEPRSMMSVSMDNGIVAVTGSDAADYVQIFTDDSDGQAKLTVSVSTGDQTSVESFPMSEVKGVRVDGLGGDDWLFVDRNCDPTFNVPVTLFGGAGD
ncbi:MAG TPA: hypothetical protein VH475_03805, partial [Tepidisphaeraceae bacterium]